MNEKTNGSKNVTVLGGYGEVGRAIVELLATCISGRITVAGRSQHKANAFVKALQENSDYSNIEFRALHVDASQDELSCLVEEQDLLLVCIPLTESLAEKIAAEVLASTADYLDVVASEEKYAVFENQQAAIRKADKRFIMNAGVEPGLQAWIARYIAHRLQGNIDITLYSKYRARNIGPAGIQEILNIVLRKPRVFHTSWKPVAPWSFRFQCYPGDLGCSISIPVFLFDLEAIPHQQKLRSLRLYQAGINLVCDIIVSLWKVGLGKCLSQTKAEAWMLWGMQRFTPKPFGIALKCFGRSTSSKIRVELWHRDLYGATARVAVMAAEKLLQNPGVNPGSWFFGQWISVDNTEQLLEQAGFTLQISDISKT